MPPAENKNYKNDIVIRLSPTGNHLVVEEHKPGGIISFKEISPIDLYFAINGSYAETAFVSSGFLPQNCLHISVGKNEKHYVLWNPELRAYITYDDIDYPDFPIPRLVFGIRMLGDGKVAECSLGVVADEAPTPDTVMYHYPFSNVHDDHKVCTGNNTLPKYSDPLRLRNFPRYLLGIPDNDDMFHKERNKLGLSHKELLELLKDKEPSYYYSHILIPSGETLKDFIRRV